jgi:hypothetical protein
MNIIRAQILDGNLQLPTITGLNDITTVEQRIQIDAMFRALWNAYLLKGPGTPINTPFWVKRINNVKLVNLVLKLLSQNNWIISRSLPNNNWAEAYLNQEKFLQYVTMEELTLVRKYKKFRKYMPSYKESTKSTQTKLGSEYLDTGLVRDGFMATGNSEYSYDTVMMEQYKDIVSPLITKGIDKMISRYPQITADLANYKTVGEDIVEALIYEQGIYTGGNRTNDPRGRNNRGDLDKIGNPVGFKIMRALLQIPEHKRNTITTDGLDAVFLFIAELHGAKNVTRQEKLEIGQRHYFQRDFIYPEKEDDVYEDIWLERLYNELNLALPTTPLTNIGKRRLLDGKITFTNYMEVRYRFMAPIKWSVFIEIDMSASVLGYIGLLLNHRPFMERCNMIGTTLTDAWAHPVITNRVQFKTIMRQCYGSQMTPAKMWDDMDIPYTSEEVAAFDAELNHGELAVAKAFKDFIIQECNPQAEMTIHVGNDKPFIKCNRHFNVGETTNIFDIYDSHTNTIRRIHHTDTKRIPDLKSFRRYFVTALVHGLDGQCMDNVCTPLTADNQSVIDIHDALLLCPTQATTARTSYAKQLDWVHTNRNQILENYFNSIGISATAMQRWTKEVKPLVIPFEGDFYCNPMVLK